MIHYFVNTPCVAFYGQVITPWLITLPRDIIILLVAITSDIYGRSLLESASEELIVHHCGRVYAFAGES